MKEGEIMTRVEERLKNVQIPPHIAKAIGLSDNWKTKISPKDVNTVVTQANKVKKSLRKLSEN